MQASMIRSSRHTFSVVATLSALWLLNSGFYTPLILGLGFVSVLLVTWLVHRMDVVDHESQPTHFTLRIFPYYAWLLWQIVLSNLTLIKCIWVGNKSINPCVAYLPSSQKTDLGRVVYANSITLTPGTVTIDVQGERLLIHALLSESVDQLKDGEMDRRVTRVE